MAPNLCWEKGNAGHPAIRAQITRVLIVRIVRPITRAGNFSSIADSPPPSGFSIVAVTSTHPSPPHISLPPSSDAQVLCLIDHDLGEKWSRTSPVYYQSLSQRIRPPCSDARTGRERTSSPRAAALTQSPSRSNCRTSLHS